MKKLFIVALVLLCGMAISQVPNNPATQTFSNLANIAKQAGGASGTRATVLGGTVAGDGGGGEFYWDGSSTASVVAGKIIKVTGVNTGRWLIITYPGYTINGGVGAVIPPNRGSGFRVYSPQIPAFNSLNCTGCALDSGTTGQIGITVPSTWDASQIVSGRFDSLRMPSVILKFSDTILSVASRHRLDSIAALKVNVADSTVKYLTPTQLGLNGGRVDSSHLPISTIKVRYPLSAVPTHDTILFNVPFIDSIAALTFVSISDSGAKYVTPTASALKANINSQVFTGTPSLPTGATGVTQSPGDNSTKFATTAYADATATPSSILNYAQSAYPLIGGTILAEPLAGGIANITSTSALTNQQIVFTLVYLPKAKTITGVKWWQAVQGSYTANNYNGVAIYSLSGGTITYIDESANDGTIWQTAANTLSSKALGSTHALSAGVYVIAALYSNSAQTTAPTIGVNLGLTGGILSSGDFANSVKLNATWTGQTAMPGSTKAMSGLTGGATQFYLSLY